MLNAPLPGIKAQFEMAPASRQGRAGWPERKPHDKLSAVLILLYPRNGELYMPLFVRTAYDGPHSRQVGLPGGRYEPEDPDLQWTALRETEEEIGVSAQKVTVLGTLSKLYIPPSKFWVHPYVGFVHDTPEFIPDPGEVAQLLEIPVSEFESPNNRVVKKMPLSTGLRVRVPGFEVHGHMIWGATAMMVNEFMAVWQAANKN